MSSSRHPLVGRSREPIGPAAHFTTRADGASTRPRAHGRHATSAADPGDIAVLNAPTHPRAATRPTPPRRLELSAGDTRASHTCAGAVVSGRPRRGRAAVGLTRSRSSASTRSRTRKYSLLRGSTRAVQLVLERPVAVRGMLLVRPERAQLALLHEHALHSIGPHCPRQLVLEVARASVEPNALSWPRSSHPNARRKCRSSPMS